MADSLQDNGVRGLVVVSGKMGAGKTMFAVRWMLEELGRGRVCYSNIKLNWPACVRYLKKRKVTVPRENYRHLESLSNFHERLAENSFVVLDEAQLEWNARDFKTTDGVQRELLTFIPQARKWGCHIVIVTQHEANVDMQFLRQAAYYYRAKDLWHYPLFRLFIPVPLTNVLKTDTDGRTVLDRFLFRRSKELGACYDTRQKFKTFSLGGAPASAVKGEFTTGSKGRYLMLLGLLLLVLAYFAKPGPEPEKPPPPVKPKRKVAEPYKPYPAIEPAAPKAPDPEDERDEIELELPSFKAVYGESSVPNPSTYGGWRPAIILDDGRQLRVGDWLCGRVLSWVRTSSQTVLVGIDHPLKTVTLYDRKLSARSRNSRWSNDRLKPVGGNLGSPGGSEILPANANGGTLIPPGVFPSTVPQAGNYTGSVPAPMSSDGNRNPLLLAPR